MRQVHERDDAIEVARLNHRRAVDAENGLQQLAWIDGLGHSISIQRDRAVLDSRVEQVVDLGGTR